MITPRQTRLYRVPHLRSFQRVIRRLALSGDNWERRLTAVIVPTAAAADQLRRTIENERLAVSAVDQDQAVVLPHIVTRAGWYDLLQAQLPAPARRLSELEREVLLQAAAREAASEAAAPFRLRPGLLVAMLGLYDDLRRRDVTVDAFERLLAGDLERDADIDRGAERLLAQTRFLAAAFRRYEAGREAAGAIDESSLRARLLQSSEPQPIRHVIVTVGERSVDAGGLWPADFDLLARLRGLEQIDVVATREVIAAGLLDRIEKLLPGFEEGELTSDDGGDAQMPVLVAPSRHSRVSVHRDREEELAAIASVLKDSGRLPLDRRAVVFKRPLPYVYLAREVFRDAGLPYQAFDALPLAAEPFAAALDVIFEAAASNFTRESVVSLLRSPSLAFEAEGNPLTSEEIFALSRSLSESGYVGGADRLRSITGAGERAAKLAASAADDLAALTGVDRPSTQLSTLLSFLDKYGSTPAADDPLRERHLRAREAIVGALDGLRRAHLAIDDTPVEFAEVAAVIRRWIESQTFVPRAGTNGVQLLDAQAARYGEFDEVFLVGLIDEEWPERSSRSIFYPASLLSQLDWPDSRAALAGERAAFRDLMVLPRGRIHVSTFELENDAVVSPSSFLEDIDALNLAVEIAEGAPARRIFLHEALTADVVPPTALHGEAAAALAMRTARADAASPEFHGSAAPYRPTAYTVSSLERYLQCPFKYFAERVLQLREDPEDEPTLNPKDLGIFVHEVFHAFFTEWNRRGMGSITPVNIGIARTVFRDVVEPLLAALPDDQAAVQRTRLLGSAVDEGLAEAVFQIEAEWETPVVERLLEHPLEGEFEIRSDQEMRRVVLRGKADRIDLLADRSFRIIDYKLSRAPERKLSLQLPIYTICTAQHLRWTKGEDWQPRLAGYIAFGQERRFNPMRGRGMNMQEVLADAQSRLLTAIDSIERGEFPPTPADTMMCTRCAYAAVCRKDYVGDV